MKRADHHLVQQVLDGDLTREAFDAFQQRLRDEPDLAKLYEGYALLQHTLSEEFEGGHAAGAEMADAPRGRFGVSLWFAAAVVVALAAALWTFRPWARESGDADVAAVTFSVDAVWWIEGESRNLGGATGVARDDVLHLLQGRANIALEPSVSALIEGPAELTFVSNEALDLMAGRGFFHRGGTGGGLTVSTPRLTAVDSGTEFGLDVPQGGPDELRVFSGTVRIDSMGAAESRSLAAGEAVRVSTSGSISRIQPDGRPFAKDLGRFRSVVSNPFDRKLWKLDYGSPEITKTRIDGMNYSAFLRLPASEPEPGATVLLAVLEVGKPSNGAYHTDGWAGMSFFRNGEELLFFGDSYGTSATWSLDVKQRTPVILPEHPVIGPRTVILRYDPRSGEVSLHDGGLPLKPPFCTGKIPPGTTFDEIRIGASAGAAIAVKSLDIRVGQD